MISLNYIFQSVPRSKHTSSQLIKPIHAANVFINALNYSHIIAACFGPSESSSG